MTGANYYCAGDHCRRTTSHLRVRMDRETYLYCVECGRRLEVRRSLEEGCAAEPSHS